MVGLSNAAVSWVSNQLCLENYKTDRLHVEGLQILTGKSRETVEISQKRRTDSIIVVTHAAVPVPVLVSQLRNLWAPIQPHTRSEHSNGIHISRGSRKAVWVQIIEGQLQQSAVIQALQRDQPAPRPPAPPRARAFQPQVYRPPPQAYHVPHVPGMTAQDYANHLASHAFYSRMWDNEGIVNPWQIPPSNNIHPNGMWSTGFTPAAAVVPSSSTSGTSSSTVTTTTTGVKVKREPGVASSLTTAATASSFNPTTTTSAQNEQPLSMQDHQLMTDLRQMGFTDNTEILQAIRANPTNADACMMWIISQREEQEEARKMDAARARSEELRSQAESSRKQAARDAFGGASMDELRDKLFDTSVILKQTSVLGSLKKQSETSSNVLYKFLQLEQKILKWYKEVPWCYLVDLATRWSKSPPSVQQVELTMGELETSMYTLSQQKGGIPKLFIEKQRDAERLGKPTSPDKKRSREEEDDDDDDVIVVLENPAPPSKKHQAMDSKPLPDVIEIL